MTKQKNEKKKAWSNQRLLKIKMEGNILQKMALKQERKELAMQKKIQVLVFRLFSVYIDLQIGYSSKT